MSKQLHDYDQKFTEAYRHFSPQLLRYVNAQIKNREVAEEIVQEIFTYLYEKRKTLDIAIPTTQSFLFTVARHRVIDYSRQKLKYIPSSDSIDEIIPDESFYTSIEDCVIEGEVTGSLFRTIAEMPEFSRKAVLLNFYLGKGVRQISRQLNSSEYRVNLVLREARLALKESLAKYHAAG